MEMLSPLKYSPPNPYTSLYKSYTAEPCCRSSSDSFYMSSITFAFTAFMDSNLVLFNTNLIFENKKKLHEARWMFQHGDLMLCQTCLHRQGVVCQCIILGESMNCSSTFHVFLSAVHEDLSKPPCSRFG